MQKRIKGSFIFIMVIMLVFTAAGCAGQNGNKNVKVTTMAASNHELESNMELSGVLVPAATVDIASKISGQVIKLGFKVGSTVKAGDVLITLDTEALNGQLMSAQASLQSALASAQATANLADIAKTNLDAAQKNYDRTKALFDSGAVSQSQMDVAQDQLNTAAKQYANAYGPARNQAQAAIDTAQANIKNISVQIANATIKSPLDGIITNQSINVGQIVSPNVAVISIVDTSVLKMKSTVGQDILPKLTVGQQIDIKIDSYPDQVYKGNISCIGPIAVNTGEVFPVEISMKNDGGLMAGLSAHASLITKVQGIIVPASSIMQNNGENYVFIINNNIAAKRVVIVGLQNDKESQILKGLNAGEQVAFTNVRALADKMPVTLQK